MSFEIKPITDFITTNTVKGYEGVKSFGLWVGHSIKSGWNDHLVPAVVKAWNFTLPYIHATVNFFKTGYGVGAVALGAAIGLHIGANKTNHTMLRTALNITAAVTLVAAGFVMGAYGADAIPGI